MVVMFMSPQLELNSIKDKIAIMLRKKQNTITSLQEELEQLQDENGDLAAQIDDLRNKKMGVRSSVDED